MVRSRNDREQLVGQVVVARDVAARPARGVHVVGRLAPNTQPTKRLHPARRELVHVTAEHLEHANELVEIVVELTGGPLTCEVGLAQTDEPGIAQPIEHRVRPHQPQHGITGPAATPPRTLRHELDA